MGLLQLLISTLNTQQIIAFQSIIKKLIQVLHEKRKSQVVMARQLNCSRLGVQTTLKCFMQTGSHQNKEKKAVANSREDQQLIRDLIEIMMTNVRYPK